MIQTPNTTLSSSPSLSSTPSVSLRTENKVVIPASKKEPVFEPRKTAKPTENYSNSSNSANTSKSTETISLNNLSMEKKIRNETRIPTKQNWLTKQLRLQLELQ